MSKIIKNDSNNGDLINSFKSFINFATNFDDTTEPKEIKTFDFEKAVQENQDEEKENFDLNKNTQEQEIKQSSEEEALSLVVNAQMREIEIINSAKEEAFKIIGRANAEAEEIKSKAYSVGFNSGKEEGLKQGKLDAKQIAQKEVKDEIDELKYNVAREIKLVDIEKQKILEEHIEDLKDIAISVGEKIALTSLKSSKDVIEKMILEATDKMKKSSWAKIYIGYTEEAINIKGDTLFLEKLSRLADNVKVIIMQADEEGTCIIETPNGTMDISVKTQVNNIKDIIKNTN